MACSDKNHRDHICDMTIRGEYDRVHALTVDAEVECGSCGAKAKDPGLVCDPIQLPDVSWMGDGADVKLN